MPGLLALIAQLGAPDDGAGRFTGDPRTFAALLVAGFLVAIAGHVVRWPPLVALGIALVFGAVLAPVVIAFGS